MNYIFESYNGMKESNFTQPHYRNSLKLWSYVSKYVRIITEYTFSTKTTNGKEFQVTNIMAEEDSNKLGIKLAKS